MTQRSYLIIHGLGGSGPQHWQTWLYNQLKERNLDVHYPTLSNYDRPNKEVWLQELLLTLEKIPQDNKITVITHSCGCNLWFHYSATHPKRKVDQAILVAPPSPFSDIPEVSSFYPLPLSEENLAQAANETQLVVSANDPYCSVEDAIPYFKLGVPAVLFPKAGHINTDAGYGPWPWILEKCLLNLAPVGQNL